MRNRAWLLLATSLLVLPAFSSATAADTPARSCASLAQLQLPNAAITSAAPVAAGAFVPPGLKPDEKIPPIFAAAPAFCRIAVTLKPTPDSDIKVEIWMPASGWNGKFRGIGNGGFAGYIAYGGLAAAVSQGYATASTDTGHSTQGAEWALGHPEKIIDYGYRGVHEMTVNAKTVVKAFYGADAKPVYFASCSNGGRQALMEAQRFPDDYDGIIAGAPANAWVPMVTRGLKELQTLDGAGYIPAAKVPAINQAVLDACDAQDGLKDGVINDPRQCHFDASVLLCKGKESDACLTSRQVDSLKMIYADAQDLAGSTNFPGLLPGAEDGRGGWTVWVTGSEEGKSLGTFFVAGYFADMVYSQKRLGFPNRERRRGRETGPGENWRFHERNESGLEAISGSWWKADPVPRLERSGDLGPQHGSLLQQLGRGHREQGGGSVCPSVHGSGHATLRRRSWSDFLWPNRGRTTLRPQSRHLYLACGVGRERQGPGRHHCIKVFRARGESARDDPPYLPLPASA